MTVNWNEDRLRREREIELEDQFHRDQRNEQAAVLATEEESKRRNHELQLTKLQIDGSVLPQRYAAATRGFIALAKAPALVVLVVMVTIISLAGKEIPQPLADFMVL